MEWKCIEIYDSSFSYSDLSKLIIKCVLYTVMMSLILSLDNLS